MRSKNLYNRLEKMHSQRVRQREPSDKAALREHLASLSCVELNTLLRQVALDLVEKKGLESALQQLQADRTAWILEDDWEERIARECGE